MGDIRGAEEGEEEDVEERRESAGARDDWEEAELRRRPKPNSDKALNVVDSGWGTPSRIAKTSWMTLPSECQS